MAKTKYGKYVFAHPIELIDTREVIRFEGGRDFGSNLAVTYVAITKPEVLEELPHSHDFDMYYSFISLHPNCLHELGAEIEMSLGEEGEKHIINTPTSIYIPKGLAHNPMKVTKVDVPFLLVHIFMTPRYSKKQES
jgi:hypothetical protein